MIVRKQIKASLRASIDDEDAALKKRLPTRSEKRRASVKLTTKAVNRMSPPIKPSVVAPAKPAEVVLSVDEAAQLKKMRDHLREQAPSVSRSDLMRVAVELLLAVGPDEVKVRLDGLPRFPKKNK
ncbi:hypothetical protein [Denitromonas ohlonensis]|uniref:Uncharacterized protein n=2 Tax=Denitromonas TaxID=139331 RepID=A0A558EVK7_9RHOO|nr:hypothetical protein [Denitromonas ohlonensis]TVO64107.1 hypothetical protein FHP90_12405 [Denitromonas ohlonensis]TVO76008.1 hypothetical protein FHP89_11080 [Denitromonas ohlonensis]TVT77394.1 MAG: hypothetical protein FHP92_04265 [Denitromonas halophila]